MSPRTRAAAAGSVPERRDVYERLADELRQEIVSGRYKPGDRLPSTLELMERTGVANLTVRGAYRMLIEEGLVEPISKRGLLRPPPQRDDLADESRLAPPAAPGPDVLDCWAADVEAAGLAHREEISVAIEDSSVLVLGTPVGERLGLPERSRVLVRRAIRYTGPAGDGTPGEADSLADEYYPYDLVRDTALASPAPANALEVLTGIGHKLRGSVDEAAAPPGHHRRAPPAQPAAGLRRARAGPHRPHGRSHAGGRAAPDPPRRRRHLLLRDQLPRPVTTGPC